MGYNTARTGARCVPKYFKRTQKSRKSRRARHSIWAACTGGTDRRRAESSVSVPLHALDARGRLRRRAAADSGYKRPVSENRERFRRFASWQQLRLGEAAGIPTNPIQKQAPTGPSVLNLRGTVLRIAQDLPSGRPKPLARRDYGVESTPPRSKFLDSRHAIKAPFRPPDLSKARSVSRYSVLRGNQHPT